MHYLTKSLRFLVGLFFLFSTVSLRAQNSLPITRFDVFGNVNARIQPGERMSLVISADASGAGILELRLEGSTPLLPARWGKEIACETTCTLTDTLYLQPTAEQCGQHTFNIVARFRQGAETVKAYRRVRISVLPQILPEAPFTRGTSNTIYWRKCNDFTHELITLPIPKSEPKQLYSLSTNDDVESDVVEQLSSGTLYGYFVKSTISVGQGLTSLLSDTVFSTQDNSPPSNVDVQSFSVDSEGSVTLRWLPATDDISYIDKYVVLRKNLNDPPGSFQLADTLNVFPVSRISPANYFPVRAENRETLYIDSGVKIKYLPELVQGSTLVKTSGKDRWNQQEKFLSFTLNVPSRIYIAMDPRIEHVPFWVDASFNFVPVRQVKTDRADGRGLDLFESKNVFPAGKVTFGGNFAEGAIFRDFADLMYVVFVKPEHDILPFASKSGVVFVDSLSEENNLKSFLYKIETMDAAGNLSEGNDFGPVILDLHRRCRPIVTHWFDFENSQQQHFARGTTGKIVVQDPQTVAACDGFRSTDSLRFQAVRENVALFSNARQEDTGVHFFDSGWISIHDLVNPFTYQFHLLPNGKDVNFVNGKTYFYRVRGKDVHGNVSAWSDTVHAVQDAFPPQDISQLTAENEAFENGSDGCIRLRWLPAADPVSGVKQYVIFRSADAGASFTRIDSVPGTQLTFCDTLSQLAGNDVFQYRIGSTDGVGNIFEFAQSSWEVNIRALRGPTIQPAANSVIRCSNGLTGVTNDSLLIAWPNFNTSGVSRYEIHIEGPASQTLVKTVNDAQATSFLCPLTFGDGFYHIRVRAFYMNGDITLFSNTLTIRKKETLQSVNNFVARQAKDATGDIILSWNHADGNELTEFQIFKWREGEQEPTSPIMTVPGDSFHLRFRFREDGLAAYQCNFFKVKVKDCFGLSSKQNSVISQYANPAPVFDSAQTVVGANFVTVCWKRPAPRVKPDDNYEVAVSVFEDSVTVDPLASVTFINKTCFTFHQPQPSHNYLFKISETILDDLGQPCSTEFTSAVSPVLIVPFQNLPQALAFAVQPLPVLPGATTGSVFVTWQNTGKKIEAFRVKWTSQDASLIDSVDVVGVDTLLVHGLNISQDYDFSLISIDSLGQRSEMNVTQPVTFTPRWEFTPKISIVHPVCFRDSVSVAWGWLDENMQLTNQTFGADSVTVEYSVDANFSFRKANRTLAANRTLNLGKNEIPFINEQNDVLYFRARAVDRWGHVSPWSTDYKELGAVSAQFDDLPPAVVNVSIDSVRAPLLSGPGKVSVYLRWPDVSDNCSGSWFYEIVRNDSVLARDTSRTAVHYFVDRNLMSGADLLNFEWTVHAVDSVGNRQSFAGASRIPLVVNPPDSLWCLNDTTVCWRPDKNNLPDLGVEYFLEGARFVELLGNPVTNIFAGPIDTLCTNFRVPWEGVFWRIKARVNEFESAWSDTFFCNLRDFKNIASIQFALESNQLPEKFALLQNYPNPFNPSTTIEFAVKKAEKAGAQVLIEIFNVAGQKVKTLVNEKKMPGNYFAVWNGYDETGSVVSSGLYVYRMRVSSFVTVRKMLFLK